MVDIHDKVAKVTGIDPALLKAVALPVILPKTPEASSKHTVLLTPELAEAIIKDGLTIQVDAVVFDGEPTVRMRTFGAETARVLLAQFAQDGEAGE